jgi:hypothetical protein
MTNHVAPDLDEYPTHCRFRELQADLRSLLSAEASSANLSTRDTADKVTSLVNDVDDEHSGTDHYMMPQHHLSLACHADYLKIWTSECAPWLDMFDQERHFGHQVPVLARTSASIFYAMLALSARQSERHKALERPSQDTLTFYSKANDALALSLRTRQTEAVVTACILGVLEMMSVCPCNWRRHFRGCASLLQILRINGFSGGLLQAVFWCYARMDLCSAIIANGSEDLIMPLERWVLVDGTPEEQPALIRKTFLQKGRVTPDMHANYVVYLCARVCDLIAKRTRNHELNEDNGCSESVFNQDWFALWQDLSQWFKKRPPELLPVKIVAASPENSHFPEILFAHWAAISSTQLYHMACVMLLEARSVFPEQVDTSYETSQLWHARQVVGISLTNHHQGSLNNAVQPLYVVGKLFSHPDEHKVIRELLDHIERSTGWDSRWRIKDLDFAWGYRCEPHVLD